MDDPIALFHFKVLDPSHQVVKESDFDETDMASACRAIAIAASLFFLSHGAYPEGSIEVDDREGHIATVSLTGEKMGRS